MIHEIKITNIGSFKEEATFSLIATDYGRKMDNVVIREHFPPILNSGIIYGANSSGKTQFIRALYDFRNQLRGNRVWEGPKNLQALYNPFKLDKDSAKVDSSLEIRFDYNGRDYYYKVKFGSAAYSEEFLRRNYNDQNDILFKREKKTTQNHIISINDGQSFSIPPYVLGLGFLLTTETGELSNVAQYIANLQICNGYNWYMRDRLWREVQSWLGNDDEKKRRKDQISQFLNAIDVKQEGVEFPVSGDADFDKIMFYHNYINNSGLVKFNIGDESNGSKWLLLLGAKTIEALENGYTIFIDELDACFHPQVTQALLKLFSNKTINVHNAQLIITTHNVNLMDEKELRRDQVWFIQKNKFGCSELFSLVDFTDVDENTPFSEWYMANRFGATPYISGLEKVFNF